MRERERERERESERERERDWDLISGTPVDVFCSFISRHLEK